MYTIKLENVNKDTRNVGNKAAMIGELNEMGIPVPPGFVVTGKALEKFLQNNKIIKKIESTLSDVNFNDYHSITYASDEIYALINNGKFPEPVEKEICAEYEELSIGKEAKEIGGIAFDLIKAGRGDACVAVRPSARSEEFPFMQFRGQFEYYLSVRGKQKLLESIKSCWASLFSPRALIYRKSKRMRSIPVMAVVVQKMLESQKSGFIFTSIPEKADSSKILIESSWGLPDSIISGAVTPDEYIIDKKTSSLITKKIRHKKWLTKRDEMSGKCIKEPVERDRAAAPVLNESEIKTLSAIALKIERHFNGSPQEIEWLEERNRFFVLQLSPLNFPKRDEESIKRMHGKEPVVSGIPASFGTSEGTARIISSITDMQKIEQGDIIVMSSAYPEIIPFMNKINGIITDDGGRVSYAAIISREFDVPCVVGTGSATSVLKYGKKIFLDALSGHIYDIEDNNGQPFQDNSIRYQDISGHFGYPERDIDNYRQSYIKANERLPVSYASGEIRKKLLSQIDDDSLTATKINLLLLSENVEQDILQEVDGVALMRPEFIISDTQKHPFFMARNHPQELVELLVRKIGSIAKRIYPKKVCYKGMDIRTDEFVYLEGGDEEPKEQNPLLGWHGTKRNIDSMETFKCEIDALKTLYSQGLDNIEFAFPFVSGTSEIRALREKINFPLKTGVMIETPAAALEIEKICKEGVSFVVINYDTLAQLVLGIDRDNVNVSKFYSDAHDTVLYLINNVVKVCRKYGIRTSISGDIVGNPDAIDKLVEMGIDSICAETDNIRDIKRKISRIERKILLERLRRS